MGKEDLIWTKHALVRLHERGIKQSDAWAAWRSPDSSRPAQKKGNWIYYKTLGDTKLEVVVAKNERGESVVISVWSRPVYKNKKRESFWRFLFKKIFKG